MSIDANKFQPVFQETLELIGFYKHEPPATSANLYIKNNEVVFDFSFGAEQHTITFGSEYIIND